MRHARPCRVAEIVGSSGALAGAILAILVWALSGPVLGFSEAWQLAINTGTTVITFLLLFVLQNSQNRDTRSLHAKMDELLRAVPEADEAAGQIED